MTCLCIYLKLRYSRVLETSLGEFRSSLCWMNAGSPLVFWLLFCLKGELKLLQEENSILREKVVNFENEQAMETKLSGKVNIARESGASGKKESAKISPDSRVQTQPVSQKKEEGERPQLTACHDKTPVKPSGKVSTPSAVYKTSTKNHQTANGVDKSMTNGTLEGSTTPQAPHPTSVRVDVHNGCEPVVNTPRATRHAQSEQPGSKDKLAETPVGKLNGVYERQPTRHRKTGGFFVRSFL